MPTSKDLWADAPIRPLGYRGLVYYYARASDGAVLEVHARDHTAVGLLGLVGGDMTWFYDAFPEDDNTIDWKAVAAYLMARCLSRGAYGPPPPGPRP